MRIKEIVLDGFKSYSVRTTIKDFDPQFNAITGLNGSGKSNVLDAICFVMGITSLKHIRVEKKQELIYKGGTAGVHKASVSLIFDNSNKEQSPPGYEDFDTIEVTQRIQDGQSKFFINSKKETQERIKSLFCSVKLNVNNPHFLIMQGRVTKVINMKPVEILGLIQEASGTMLFQNKREIALNQLQKKQLKLSEIENIMVGELNPKMERLNREKAELEEYKVKVREVEETSKMLTAHRFYDLLKTTNEPHKKAELDNKIDKFEKLADSTSAQIDQVKEQSSILLRKHEDCHAQTNQLDEEIKKKEIEHHKLKLSHDRRKKEKDQFQNLKQDINS